MNTSPSYQNYSLAAFLLLLPFFLLAFFVWPSSDDYAMAVMYEGSESFSEVVKSLYGKWGGRYSTWVGALPGAFLVKHLWLYRFMVLATLVLLVLSVRWFWGVVVPQNRGKGLSALVAGAFLLLWFQVMPGTADSLYWYSGMVVYTWPLVLFFFLAGGLLKERKPWWLKVLLILSAFAMVGFNEMAAIIALLTVAVFALMGNKKGDVPLKISLLVAVTAGLLLLLLSPGNAQRMALFANNSNLWDALRISLVSLVKLNGIHIQSISLWLLVLLVFPWLDQLRLPVFSAGSKEDSWLPVWCFHFLRHPVAVIILGQAVLWGLLFVPAWSMGINPPLRVYNFLSPLWLLWLLWLLTSIRSHFANLMDVGWPVFRGTGLKAMVLLIALSLMVNFVKIPGGEVVFGGNVPRAWHDLAFRAAGYNRAMHQREALIKAALQQGESTLTLPRLHNPPGTIHFLDIFPDPDHWINRMMAEYYGVERVEMREK
ncbi:MAG: hypothetical protein EA361_19870 [Bacteroidetes bacterium]|nr:MAG: hypothetical protein EA361_19870 [Bacteroidota bacterium]